ncbi:MAG: DUF2797 domain-containing protein [Crocinitomicaceae bacterium]|nr:DUF2797 domain-containing protein [Crocinitomicaceae bacterium]
MSRYTKTDEILSHCMKISLNLRKMRTCLDGMLATYILPITDVLEITGQVALNPLIGEKIIISFENEIHCVAPGKKIKKTFGEGFSYEAWLTSPMACPSIVNPELSRIHEGIALRDREWEEQHHNQPHYVYLSRTGDVKVGVTRTTNVPMRWIDQGAVEAIVVAETPYRQLAGLIEVALKNDFPDKTNWQNMLKNIFTNASPLIVMKDKALSLLAADYGDFFLDDDTVTKIEYPVIAYPEKVKSVKLDTCPVIKGKLSGIKGQYLLFEDGRVFNVRSHSGYRVSIEA